MAKRSGSALERGAKKAARASSKLVEINYDGEWYMGEILKEIADGGANGDGR